MTINFLRSSLIGLAVLIAACSGTPIEAVTTADGGTGGAVVGGSGGSSAGSGGVAATGTGGSDTTGSGGVVGTGGAAATGGAPGSGGAVAGSGGAGGGNVDAGPGPSDASIAIASPGCGKPAGQAIGSAVRGTIPTMGTKAATCADGKCGAWSYDREYFVTLPVGYDSAKAYPLVFEGSSCNAGGQQVYPLNNSVDNTVIRVGLTAPPNDIAHATNPGQLCYDDREGDDSVDFVFYENLYDRLTGQFCVDKSRVFAAGTSSGGSLADQLGCRYAGDASRPVRGALDNGGALPTAPAFAPTCTTKPMAGMWIYGVGGVPGPDYTAVSRAIQVNGCGGTFATAQFDNFPVTGNPDGTCRKIRGCPAAYPLVVCDGMNTGAHETIADPGFSAFIQQLE